MTCPDIAHLVRLVHVLDHCSGGARLLEVLWPAHVPATPALHSHTRLHLDTPADGQVDAPVVTRVGSSTDPWPVAGPFDTIALGPLPEGVWDETWLASLARASSLLSPRGTLLVVPPARLGTSRCARDLRHEGFTVTDTVGLTAPPDDAVAAALGQQFGPGATELHMALRSRLPASVVGPVVAAAGDVAVSSLLVCRRP